MNLRYARRRLAPIVLLVVSAALLPALGGALPAAGADAPGAPSLAAGPAVKPGAAVEVRIDNFSFAPAALEVAAGTTVTWVNRDDIPHTVVSSESVFKSKALDTDATFSYVFAKTGTYSYFCSLHPKMTGTVVVK